MLSTLSTELVLQVYDSLNYSDVLNLSLVCKRFHQILPPARKLSTYFAAADREFGPLCDAIQVVVLQVQTPYMDQDPPLSFTLLRSLIRLGRVAKRFEEAYPSIKWSENFVDRRVLTAGEQYRVRRAVYRFWRYSAAFHTAAFPRTTRLLYSSLEKRMALLRFPTDELLELEDMRRVIQEFISNFIVPKDVHDKLFGNCHFSMCEARPSALGGLFHTFGVSSRNEPKECLQNADWEDDISHYYLVQDLLKLDPGQIIWLKENASFKWQVETFIENLGEWFQNNGETLAQTVNMVLLARGCEDLVKGLDAGDFGIAGKSRQEPWLY